MTDDSPPVGRKVKLEEIVVVLTVSRILFAG